ncbi:MAG: hypothetical protein ACK4VV_16720 [Pseudomonas sp.]
MRATLLVVWFTLNSCLTTLFLFDGSLIPSLPRLVLYLPLLVIGVLLGEYLHRRLNEQRFRQVVYGLLADNFSTDSWRQNCHKALRQG